MASSSGYVLFSQTSRPFGTRDFWGSDALPGTLAGTVPGLVNGVIADFAVSAFDAFQGREVVRGDWALFDFGAGGQTAPAAPLTGAIDAGAVTSDGRVFAGPAGPRNPGVAFDADPAGGLSIVLADRDWNGIKNVELFLTNAELVYDGSETDVFIRNIVDVRVKLGDSLATAGGPPRRGVGRAVRRTPCIVIFAKPDMKTMNTVFEVDWQGHPLYDMHIAVSAYGIYYPCAICSIKPVFVTRYFFITCITGIGKF